MKIVKKYKTRHLFQITALCVGSFLSTVAFGEVVIIVHPSQDIASVSKSDISRVFLGKSKTLMGKGVSPINQAITSDVRASFDNSILGKSPNQIKAYWSKQLFSGNGVAPKEFASDAEIIEQVANNKKLVGYIDSSALSESVKALTVK